LLFVALAAVPAAAQKPLAVEVQVVAPRDRGFFFGRRFSESDAEEIRSVAKSFLTDPAYEFKPPIMVVVEDGDKIVRVTVSTRTEKNRTEGWGGQGGWGGYGGRTRRTGEEANLSIELLAPLPDGRCESLRTISLSGSGRNIEWEVFTPYGGAGRRTDGGRRRIKGYRAALEAALEELFSGR